MTELTATASVVPADGSSSIKQIGRGLSASLYGSLVVVTLVFLAASIPRVLQTHDPFEIDLGAALQAPSLAHWWGTDQSGRDLFSRVVEGASQSLAIGLGATGISMTIALVLGSASGLLGGRVDAVLSRLFDVLFSLPTLLLALLFLTIFGPSVLTLVASVGIGTSPGYARMVRGQILAVKVAGYVESATALGHARGRILSRHILPNALMPLTSLFTLGVGQAMIWASGLAFLGGGVAPPAPEWGALLYAGRNYVTFAWWLEVMPGLAIALFALSLTVIGRHVQARLLGRDVAA